MGEPEPDGLKASAVALADTSIVLMPKTLPKKVGMALLWPVSRYTVTVIWGSRGVG
jgi:hypothetical protein